MDYFSPKYGKILAIFEEFLILIIFKISEICSKLPFSKILLATPSFWQVILYYIIVVMIVVLFNLKKMKVLKFLLGKKSKIFIKQNSKRILAILTIIILFINIIKIIPQKLKIYFVDVGQRRLLCYSNTKS